MPRLWTDTIDGHRRKVHDAVLDAAERIVTADGVLAVNMSRLATEAGIGRKTLYGYFPDVVAVLGAWHGRQVDRHLEALREAADGAPPSRRLRTVLLAHARMAREQHRAPTLPLDGDDGRVAEARARVLTFVAQQVEQAQARSELPEDLPPSEAATFSVHALAAAARCSSGAAVERLVDTTLRGLGAATR